MNQTQKIKTLTALEHARAMGMMINRMLPHIDPCTKTYDTAIAILHADIDHMAILAEKLVEFYGKEFERNEYTLEQFAENILRDRHDSIEEFIKGPLAKAAYKILMEEKRNTHEPETNVKFTGQCF
jgi:hypothetical protein